MDREQVQAIIGTGEFKLGGTTSTSRKPTVAHRFMRTTSDEWDGGKYKIMFVLKQKSGVHIETISQYRDEAEILMSKDARFSVKAVERYPGRKRVLIVHAEEI